MEGRCYTLDVNPTSGSRVKVRLYETRPVREGGNVLLLQGQLSVRQFRALEELFLAGAGEKDAEVVRLGRYYTLPQLSDAEGAAPRPGCVESRPAARGPRCENSDRSRSEDAARPRAPWITGPVIGPSGVVDDDDADDYDTIARRHVERSLQRRRAVAS